MTGHDREAVLSDAFRLAVGTLTALPVSPPNRIDPRRAGLAMASAPAAALLPGAAAGVAVTVALLIGLSTPLAAVLAVGTVVLSTRGMHLDGLADTADGLAASYHRERALTVMRSGDTGPAGVTAVVLVLLVQVAALAQGLSALGPAAVVIGVVLGRLPLAMACSRGVPSARPEGLGATVAGSVSRPLLALSLIGTTILGTALLLFGSRAATALPDDRIVLPLLPDVTAAAGIVLISMTVIAAVTFAVTARVISRLGGITGDVLGALVEIGTMAAFLSLAAFAG